MKNQIYPKIVKIMERGLMVIPKEIRDDFGLTNNSYVSLVKNDDGFMVKPIAPIRSDSDTYFINGLEIIPAKKYSQAEALAILDQTRGIWTKTDFRDWQRRKTRERKRAKWSW